MRKFEELIYNKSFDELNNMVRWNGFNRIKDETVGEHSFIVAWLTRIICEEIFFDNQPKLEATTYAIFHDFNEFITGDVNHNVKYNKFNGEQIKDNLNDYIEHTVNEMFPINGSKADHLLNDMLLENIPSYIKKIVKLCDWMSMLMYLKKEKSLGNSNAGLKAQYCEKMMLLTAEDCIVDLGENCNCKVDISILK